MVEPSPPRLVPVARRGIELTVAVPGSKSIANRALICAALADGQSTVAGVPGGDDTEAMLDALASFGAAPSRDGDAVTIAGGAVSRGGEPIRVDARLAGTTSRFLTALAALRPAAVLVDGRGPLRRRPMGLLHDALGALGATVTPSGPAGGLPVEVCGPARGGAVRLRGDVSSQFLTALMLIGPYLAEGLRIELSTPLVSRPYVEMTAAVMAAFGHRGVRVDAGAVTVDPGGYRPTVYAVEPDASSASYPLAAAALTGGTVRIPGLAAVRLQGDRVIADIVAAMGCRIETDGDDLVCRGGGLLRAIDLDLADASDLVPTVSVLAVLAKGTTMIRGVGFIRAKESDRLGDLAGELAKLGASVTVTADGLAVDGGRTLHAADLDPHHDHRLAMSLATLGLVVGGVRIDDPGTVAKSWPGFWEELERWA